MIGILRGPTPADQHGGSLSHFVLRAAVVFVVLALLAGCSNTGFNVPDPVPDDRRDIPPPNKQKIHILADGFDKQISRQFGQMFDNSRNLRKLFGKPKQAMNVNAFDEIDDSSWFTNRNAKKQMPIEEIKRGPNTGGGPETAGPWTIIGAKTEGVTPGFTIEDSEGGRFVIKFDPKGWPEMTTSAELISTKLFYASGYNTPENYLTYFDPKILRVGDVMIEDNGEKRSMNENDLRNILARVDTARDGKIRAVASKFIDGKLIGPFKYHKTRKDDPNDLIPHEHRRELRGLRVIAAWLNHYDTKANNSLDAYVEEDGRRFVKHFLIDFGSTLGSEGDEPKPVWTGYENTFDPHQVTLNTLALGLYVPSWEKKREIRYRSIGLFDSHAFHPQKFKFIFPNLAFENLTKRDGYWGAKIVTSFTDEQLEAAVSVAEYSDPNAAAYLVGVLKERRDIVGRYWFSRVNTLDNFDVADGALSFTDLAFERGYRAQAQCQYTIRKNGEIITEYGELEELDRSTGSLSIPLPPSESGLLEVRLRNRIGDGDKWSKWLSVYVNTDDDSGDYSLVAIMRGD
ncbi:MAG: hypothetical protein JSW58_09490 [Candidatus Latescibacterota bacterium]|nr:MAG: hypothetical protein JSW58_09490 [Candidatus Latescibacterota bacterium]